MNRTIISNSLGPTGPSGGPGIVGVPSDIFHVCDKCFCFSNYWFPLINNEVTIACSECNNSGIIEVTEFELKMKRRNKKLDEILS